MEFKKTPGYILERMCSEILTLETMIDQSVDSAELIQHKTTIHNYSDQNLKSEENIV